jgi:hypothetical protein
MENSHHSRLRPEKLELPKTEREHISTTAPAAEGHTGKQMAQAASATGKQETRSYQASRATEQKPVTAAWVAPGGPQSASETGA